MPADIPTRLLEAWRRNNAITEKLLAAVTKAGLAAVPAGSRGRTVAEQFRHVIDGRLAWAAFGDYPRILSSITSLGDGFRRERPSFSTTASSTSLHDAQRSPGARTRQPILFSVSACPV